MQEHLTLLDHLIELRSRFMWMVSVIIIGSIAGYLGREIIIAWLLNPLDDRRLVYTSLAGGVNFLLKICVSTGLLIALPVLLYHCLHFFAPVSTKRLKKKLSWILLGSAGLAASGAAFAYYVCVPPALRFLYGFSTTQIQALVTTDSYLNFILIYLLSFAAVFQLPLLIILINYNHPLNPRKMFSYQRYVVVASFIMAAVITPTPDLFNQCLVALPIIIMYQIGITAVWLIHRPAKPTYSGNAISPQLPINAPKSAQVKRSDTVHKPPLRSIDGFIFSSAPGVVPSTNSTVSTVEAAVVAPNRRADNQSQPIQRRQINTDGSRRNFIVDVRPSINRSFAPSN